MVVVDSSALIPLSWVGRLNLLTASFDEIHTTQEVHREVVTEGKRGASALRTFLEGVTIHPSPDGAQETAKLEGIAIADASIILLADDLSMILLANDKGLIEVAQTQGVQCWWVTTLLLKSTKAGTLTSDRASEILYNLVDSGMNLHPRVYARVQQALEEASG